MHTQLSEELGDQILAGVYSDINLISLAKRRNERQSRIAYCVDYLYASELLDKALSHENYPHMFADMPPSDHQDQIDRLHDFVDRYGWHVFAICAFSPTFRHSVSATPSAMWERVENNIARNIDSLELFSETRKLGAESLLLEKGIQEKAKLIGPKRKLIKNHPHHWVLKANGTIAPPIYEGHLQEHIDKNIFNPHNWWSKGITQDPTLRKRRDGPCYICDSPTPCDCVTPSHEFTALVELREYKGKGTGVRALGPFKKGQILGQFVGEIKPVSGRDDLTYSLLHGSRKQKAKTLISPKRYGNWTRFINHSCDSSTAFLHVVVGRHTAMVVYAKRDIAPFEEITVDYGSGYLANLACKCGSRSCRGSGLVRVL